MTRDSVVMLEEDRALAARTADPGVEVLDFSRGPDGWSAEVRAGSPNGPSDGSVHIASGGADPTNEWSTYVYGTARPNVSRVVLPGLDGQGGQVVDGAWVIGVKSGDVAVGQLAWQFLDATGNVVKSGQGPYPPAP